MTSDQATFVDPSSLSLPSPASEDNNALDSPMHSSQALSPDAGSSSSLPPRKRARTEMTTEERKEARAHRNRIAAQNSRDKRKAQFSTLERRVAELEEENRQLRAGMGIVGLQRADDDRHREELEREKSRERENAELKERIRSLEKGWEAVMKVLTTQGLPTGIVPPTPTSQSPPSPSSSNSPTTFPVFVPSSPVVFPLTPSPSLSAKSVYSTMDGSSNPTTTSLSESTRHLARVAIPAVTPTAGSQQRVDSSPSSRLLLSKLHPLLLARLRLQRQRRQQQRISNSHRHSTTQRQRHPWTRLPWTLGSTKSSRPLPPSRRRRFILFSSRQKRSQPPPPSPRPPGRR